MTMILEQLHKDHAEMTKVLSVLEREIELEKGGQNADYELIRAILDYCAGYPALCHHPMEDLVYRKLRLLDDFQKHDLLSNVLTEHWELNQDRLELAAALDNLEEDADASPTGFHPLAERFLERYRVHMAQEEMELFTEARRSLSPEDWADLDARALQRRKSPTGTMFSTRFEKLRSEIFDAAGVAS